MKNKPYDSYDKIFEALLAFGYSGSEAERMICDVIEDQKDFDDIAGRIHKILEEDLKNRIS